MIIDLRAIILIIYFVFIRYNIMKGSQLDRLGIHIKQMKINRVYIDRDSRGNVIRQILLAGCLQLRRAIYIAPIVFAPDLTAE